MPTSSFHIHNIQKTLSAFAKSKGTFAQPEPLSPLRFGQQSLAPFLIF